MHPHLNAVLIDQRRMRCPCGAHAGRPNTLCRKCHHTALWLRHTRRAKRADRAARRLARRGTRHSPAILVVALLFRAVRS